MIYAIAAIWIAVILFVWCCLIVGKRADKARTRALLEQAIHVHRFENVIDEGKRCTLLECACGASRIFWR